MNNTIPIQISLRSGRLGIVGQVHMDRQGCRQCVSENYLQIHHVEVKDLMQI